MRLARSLLAAVALGGCASPAPIPSDRGEDLARGGPAIVVEAGSAPAPAASAAAPIERVSESASAPPGEASSALPASTACPRDMVDVGVACIDRFEAPNVRGEKPLLMQTAEDGARWCKERDKRLCTEDEWVRACEGPHHRAFPYGTRYVEGTCNDDGVFRDAKWKVLGRWPSDDAKEEARRLDQSEASGARAACVSEEGVFDLTGNAAEWVVRTRKSETNFDHVLKGCFWGKCFRKPHTPSCDYVNFAHPGTFRSYETTFRCCADRRRS